MGGHCEGSNCKGLGEMHLEEFWLLEVRDEDEETKNAVAKERGDQTYVTNVINE